MLMDEEGAGEEYWVVIREYPVGVAVSAADVAVSSNVPDVAVAAPKFVGVAVYKLARAVDVRKEDCAVPVCLAARVLAAVAVIVGAAVGPVPVGTTLAVEEV
jgi:hypothetical protein